MKFIPREMNRNWFKRRTPSAEEMVVREMEVTVPEFEKIHNHECEMIVTFDTGEVYTLSARCHLNDLATPNRWTVQGMDTTSGVNVLADVVE